MLTTHLTQKGQATIPAKIRKLLKLTTGDLVKFSVQKGTVTLSKATKADQLEKRALSKTLEAEWSSDADDKAYENL